MSMYDIIDDADMAEREVYKRKMANIRKPVTERKATVGISLSNRLLRDLDEYCELHGLSRSFVVEQLLRDYLEDYNALEVVDTIIDRGLLQNAEY